MTDRPREIPKQGIRSRRTTKEVHRAEPKINLELAKILESDGLDVTWESEISQNRRIDIEVKTGDNIRIAIECEKQTSVSRKTKHAEAIKDAVSRLYPAPVVDIAVALVYPSSCRSTADLNRHTEIECATVTYERARLIRNSRGSNLTGIDRKDTRMDFQSELPHVTDTVVPSVHWEKIPAGHLSYYVSNLHRDVGQPDIVAGELSRTLTDVVRRLTKNQHESLAMSLKFNYVKPAKSTATNQQNNDVAENAAKRALLVIAGAALFHAKVSDHIPKRKPENCAKWPPKTLDECLLGGNVRNDLIDTWTLISTKVDYRPIFDSAISVLSTCTGRQFSDAVREVAKWASKTADKIDSMRHDLLGNLFHRVLDSAPYDGSFYTSVPTATLLAGIAMEDCEHIHKQTSNYKIMDPSCGTGTLLMAAAERLMHLNSKLEPRLIVEDVLYGVDINATACHLAATTIGLLSPVTKFSRMNIYVAKFGNYGNDGYHAGSLEMYESGKDPGLLPYTNWEGGSDQQINTGVSRQDDWQRSIDLLIMNPPFTRNALAHDHLGPRDEAGVTAREADIFSDAPPGIRHGSGPMFILLAEKLLKRKGTLAMVLPLVVTNSAGNMTIRKFLAKNFHIDTIVVSHDPRRPWFSDSTSIAEVLIVAKRPILSKKPTRVISLASNPDTVRGAASLVVKLQNNMPDDTYSISNWSHQKIIEGDWSAVLFYSPYLVESFASIKNGTMFRTQPLGSVASTGEPPQGVRMIFAPSDSPPDVNKDVARPSRYDHSTSEVTCMHSFPNKYLIRNPKHKKSGNDWKNLAGRSWNKGGYLHIVERARLNLTHVVALKTDSKSVGSSWHSVTPNDVDPRTWSQAMSVYLNSSIGIVAMLGVRTPKIPDYPRWGVGNIRTIPIPIMNNNIISLLSDAYNIHCDSNLGTLKEPSNVRVLLDEVVCDALGLNKDTVVTMRQQLSVEPMVTQRRVGKI